MDEQQKRLVSCFLSVFPELAPEDVEQATSASLEGWDSVASITLLTVIEEEFGINIEIDDPARFNSFKNISAYLQEIKK
jgi:acyl carrier protein